MSDILRSIHASIEARSDLRAQRTLILRALAPLQKKAFDSRRTNQYTDYNPRNNLQYYHRSDAFVPKPMADSIKSFLKLKTATDSIKDEFLGDPAFFDSYARVLCAAVDRTLRIDQKDGDHSMAQMDYLKEILYLRYRLNETDIEKLSSEQIRSIVLGKDEKLAHKEIHSALNNGGMMKTVSNDIISKNDIKIGNMQLSQMPYVQATLPTVAAPPMSPQDLLIDRLFGNVKADADNKNVKRSVTITIDESIVDNIKVESKNVNG